MKAGQVFSFGYLVQNPCAFSTVTMLHNLAKRLLPNLAKPQHNIQQAHTFWRDSSSSVVLPAKQTPKSVWDSTD